MNDTIDTAARCECGETLVFPEKASPASLARCGAGADAATTASSEARHGRAVARLEPERSVPLSGFSNELRQTPDAERFRFSFALRGGGVPLPVHILFSPSRKSAEVKAADLKAYRLEGVESAGARAAALDRLVADRPARPRSRGASPLVPRAWAGCRSPSSVRAWPPPDFTSRLLTPRFDRSSGGPRAPFARARGESPRRPCCSATFTSTRPTRTASCRCRRSSTCSASRATTSSRSPITSSTGTTASERSPTASATA